MTQSEFLSLAEDHWQRLVALARSVVGDSEAEDVVQDGLLLAWQKLHTLRDLQACAPWLTRIVLRLCLRRARRRRNLLPISAAPEPIASPEPPRGLDVERLLRRLAPRQRTVMHLTVIEGMTDSEIAAVMEISAASVRSHRRRARARLHRLLASGETK